MSDTPLDLAHAAMQTSDSAAAAERAFYAQLAASELFLMLTDTPEGDQISPELFDLGDATFVLAFDTEERLAGFAGRIVPYVALSGRALAQMLAGQGIGLALNPEAAPSSMLLPPEAMAWLAETTAHAPRETHARIEEVMAPMGLPEVLLTTLDAQLAGAQGLARSAYLVGVRYEGGGQGHLLGVVDVMAGAEPALARAVQEALTFSGLEAGALDVAFFEPAHAMAATLARHGLRFDLPQGTPSLAPQAPGMDPDKPPRLV
ncbi:SseB family protein [Roseobacteraceae bacterium S113]